MNEPINRWTSRGIDEWMDKRTDFPFILQGIVPSGLLPKNCLIKVEKKCKKKNEDDQADR